MIVVIQNDSNNFNMNTTDTTNTTNTNHTKNTIAQGAEVRLARLAPGGRPHRFGVPGGRESEARGRLPQPAHKPLGPRVLRCGECGLFMISA